MFPEKTIRQMRFEILDARPHRSQTTPFASGYGKESRLNASEPWAPELISEKVKRLENFHEEFVTFAPSIMKPRKAKSIKAAKTLGYWPTNFSGSFSKVPKISIVKFEIVPFTRESAYSLQDLPVNEHRRT